MLHTWGEISLSMGGFSAEVPKSLQVFWQRFPWLMPERPASTQLHPHLFGALGSNFTLIACS